MSGARHTPEEIDWIKSKFKLIGEKFNAKKLEELKLSSEFHKKFGKIIGAGGLATWIRTIRHPEQYNYQAVKARRLLREQNGIPGRTKRAPNLNKLLKVLEQSRFILYIFNEGITGYDTKKEVKAYLADRKTQSPIKLFENIPAEVKLNVEVVI